MSEQACCPLDHCCMLGYPPSHTPLVCPRVFYINTCGIKFLDAIWAKGKAKHGQGQ